MVVLWPGSIFFADHMRILLLILLFLTAVTTAQSQVSDSLQLQPDTALFNTRLRTQFSMRWHLQPHSPFKATILSLALPGAGQMYNGAAKDKSFFGKYWKVPVVWAGIGTCIAFIDYNSRNYHYFRRQYIAAADEDPATQPTESTNSDYLKSGMDYFGRLMDISYMSLMGVYMLQAIEANVDAHLFYYDISNDLSLRWQPVYFAAGHRRLGLGLTLQF